MRTALVLLLLLALAAVPGSVIPQSGVNAQGVTRWQEAHPKLTPIYERLGLFSVYSSPWFAAVYLLLVISLVGCIIPRLVHYFRAFRAQPPAAPANLSRLPAHAAYEVDASPEAVLAHARRVLGRRHRLRKGGDAAGDSGDSGDAVSAERGQLREAGNLVFHLSVLIVLAGFAMGGLFGFQGGVVIVEGTTFSNNLTQYDDFNPGSLFRTSQLDPFCFTVDKYDDQWLTSGPRAGMAVKFNADISYQDRCGHGASKRFDLEVNHPLDIGSTEVFLIGHGYAPVITVRDGQGHIAYQGPTIFLPQDSTFLSYGVVKAPTAKPGQIGLEGLLYPTFALVHGNPVTVFPNALNPLLSMLVYTGDLGLDSGAPQSVYVLDKSHATQVTKPDGKPFRLDLKPGQTTKLPNGLGSVTFNGVKKWVRVQISQTPGKRIALGGVILALIGLCCSLFIRPRRVWVRARRVAAVDGADPGDTMERTVVEVAVLDRSGNADVQEILDDLVESLKKGI
jgi:cytochrome c biogenesis protein